MFSAGHSAIVALNSTLERPNEDSKTVLTNTADQSTNSPTSQKAHHSFTQSTSSLIITPPTIFHLFHSGSFIPIIVSVRKAREAHIINKANTLEPLGLNKKDQMLSTFSLIFLYRYIVSVIISCYY